MSETFLQYYIRFICIFQCTYFGWKNHYLICQVSIICRKQTKFKIDSTISNFFKLPKRLHYMLSVDISRSRYEYRCETWKQWPLISRTSSDTEVDMLTLIAIKRTLYERLNRQGHQLLFLAEYRYEHVYDSRSEPPWTVVYHMATRMMYEM